MSLLTFQTISELYSSSDSFPVSLNDTWEWLEYSRKDKCVQAFLRCEFEENIDYLVFPILGENSEGRPSMDYRLSCDCFKHFSMMSKSEGGKKVRNYFIECEKIVKEFYKDNQRVDEKLKTVKKIENCFKGITNLQNKLQTFQIDNPKLFKVVSSDYQQLDIKPLAQLPPKEPSENDLKASLIANRLGLAFNKQIKAFEALQSTLSPDAYNSLREEFNQLQKDNQELAKLKTPQVVVEKVYDSSTNQELLGKNKKLLVENENLKVNLQMLQNELSAKENVLSNLKNALDEMQNMTRRKMNAVSNIGETVSSLAKKV